MHRLREDSGARVKRGLNKTCRIKQLTPTYINVRIKSPLLTCALNGHLESQNQEPDAV